MKLSLMDRPESVQRNARPRTEKRDTLIALIAAPIRQATDVGYNTSDVH